MTPAAAIALNADPATKFDQIMAIHDPRTPGTAAYIEILNSDGSLAEACGNGMRCVVQALSAETGQKSYRVRDARGHPDRRRECRRLDHRRYGQAPDGLAGHSAGRGVLRHDRDRAADRADRCAGAAHAVGGLDGQSARHVLGRGRRQQLCARPLRAAAREPSAVSRALQYLDRAGGGDGPHHRPHLGARGRADPRLRHARPARRWSTRRAPSAPAARRR